MRNRPPASNEAPARGGDSGASGGGNLTPRQLEVLELLAKGLSNQDICRLLGISANTVKAHVAAILRSLGVENRTEAASAHQRVVQAGHRAAVRARAARQVRRPAIAVLPFVNLADAADRDRLAAGLVDDLITRLAGWRWFPVIASAASGRFPADQSDLEQVRRELGAAYLIRGSVRQLDARIRVAARLLESEHGRTIWSGSFETKVEDLFAAQDETARRIVACLAPELMDVEGDRVRTAAAGDFGAWHLTMQGMWHLARRTRADVAGARTLFDRAIEADPAFSLAWFGLTWVHHHNLIEQWSDDPAAERTCLERAAAECVRLDPSGAPGQIVAGLVEMLCGNRDKAMNHLEKALLQNPSDTRALSLLGQCYGLSGRPDECIAVLEEALELNPYSPTRWVYQGVIALAHFAAGRLDHAVESSRDALAGRPGMITAHLTLCAALAERDELAAAREVARQLQARRPGFEVDDFIDLIAPSAGGAHIARLRTALAAAGLASPAR